MGGENWRGLMADAREVALELAISGDVELTRRGNVIDPDGDWTGPIRIRTTVG
ncbi:MAG: DUF3253 domain-containing protein [Mycobacterium sp.]